MYLTEIGNRLCRLPRHRRGRVDAGRSLPLVVQHVGTAVSAVFILHRLSVDLGFARTGCAARLSRSPFDDIPSCGLMGVQVEHNILFNFAASPVGGGLKRLSEYAKWFDAHGGARFIIHPRCEHLRRDSSRNEFVVARQSGASRILRGVRRCRSPAAIGTPDCYYAYGIPLDGRVGRLNWFHLSNVLPLAWPDIPLAASFEAQIPNSWSPDLKGLPYADVISAESDCVAGACSTRSIAIGCAIGQR